MLLYQKMMVFSVGLLVNHLKACLPDPLLDLLHLWIVMITASSPPMITAFLEPFGFSKNHRQAHALAFRIGFLNILLPGELDGEIQVALRRDGAVEIAHDQRP